MAVVGELLRLDGTVVTRGSITAPSVTTLGNGPVDNQPQRDAVNITTTSQTIIQTAIIVMTKTNRLFFSLSISLSFSHTHKYAGSPKPQNLQSSFLFH